MRDHRHRVRALDDHLGRRHLLVGLAALLRSAPGLTLPRSKTFGAPSAIDRASVATCGSTSYSTLIARIASRAWFSVSAATAAMSSP